MGALFVFRVRFPHFSHTGKCPPGVHSGKSLLGFPPHLCFDPLTRRSCDETASRGKAPPNLPPGVPPLLPNPYIVAPGLLPAYQPQVYGYDDLQMLQTRFPLDYYGIPFAAPTTPITGREASLTNNPYSGDLTKFGRGDASSPAPATTLAQPQQNQTQSHHTTQQTFLNPALPPGYSYTSLPYYAGVPGLPNTFQYGPAMFAVPPTSSKQHGVNVNAPATAFQQASGYGTHGYSTERCQPLERQRAPTLQERSSKSVPRSLHGLTREALLARLQPTSDGFSLRWARAPLSLGPAFVYRPF
ncbi:hypothetical protein chiPu_0021659 [Chiloscyllium punctatum]|uniref:Uncharacterized protein n=1 Tax=Chiloscyllium punctatum TaxID=137246 RepID=A0A401RJN6_CHIPU|nr:hypothetical protein [Chiloscyllium punctatum]